MRNKGAFFMTDKLERLTHQQCISAPISVCYWMHSLSPHRCRFINIITSTTIVSELAGIHTTASFAQMNGTLHNVKQCKDHVWTLQYVYVLNIILPLSQQHFRNWTQVLTRLTKSSPS